MPRWTPEARKKQADQTRRAKPWLHSTGPRTAAGKAKVAGNSLRHGARSAAMRRLRAALRRQREFRNRAVAYLAYRKACPNPRPDKSIAYPDVRQFLDEQTGQNAPPRPSPPSVFPVAFPWTSARILATRDVCSLQQDKMEPAYGDDIRKNGTQSPDFRQDGSAGGGDFQEERRRGRREIRAKTRRARQDHRRL